MLGGNSLSILHSEQAGIDSELELRSPTCLIVDVGSLLRSYLELPIRKPQGFCASSQNGGCVLEASVLRVKEREPHTLYSIYQSSHKCHQDLREWEINSPSLFREAKFNKNIREV